MALMTSVRSLTSRSLRPRRLQTPPPIQIRSFSHTSLARFPRKGNEDKGSIDTEATENSMSGTNDASARQEKAAFDPKTTDPEQEKKVAGEGNERSGNPLEVSPANPEVSKQTGVEGDAEKSAASEKKSGAGSPKKAGVTSGKS